MPAKRSRRRGRQQFVVIGLGRFGASVARTLAQMGYEVLAIDQDEDCVQALAAEVTHAAQADATDEEALRSLGVRNFDVAVVGIGAVEASVLTTLVLRSQGVKYVVAKASSELHRQVLEKVGADKVLFPERDMGIRVAHNLISGNFLDYLELAPGYSIMEFLAPASYVGFNLRQLDLRARFGISIIAIRKKDGRLEVAPGADSVIENGDILVAMGTDDMMEKIENDRR